MKHGNRLWVMALAATQTFTALGAGGAEYLWVEAEHSTDIQGANYSWVPASPLEQQRGWGIAGPGVAAEWTQGGESEWTSIAAHAQEKDATARYTVEVPAAGRYRVWVRYADYQHKNETFRVRVQQAGKAVFDQAYGGQAVVPEDDEVKLMWGWAFGWGQGEADLQAGPAELQLVVDAPAESRRHVDAILVTDDLKFRPLLREKPPFHYWGPLRKHLEDQIALNPAFASPAPDWAVPPAWRTPPMAGRDFQMLFNMPVTFWKQGDVPAEKRVLYPFHQRPADVEKRFIEQYGGRKDLPVWSSKLNVPVIYFQELPEFLSDDSPFLAWLRETKSPFGILLNYAMAPPSDTFGDKGPMLARNLASVQAQFVGYMAGENTGYTYSVDYAAQLDPALIAKAADRQQVLDLHRDALTPALRTKFERAYGTPPAAGDSPWPTMMSAMSTDMFPYVHAFAEWGERTLAHEATANMPAYAINWAFLRGASRQFGRNWVWYHSSNFGDTATTFIAGQNIAGPHTNYHHSHYDAFSGAGLVWYRKAYYSAYMAGAAGIYLEQGFDQYFVPSPGDERVQLSPFGRITDEFIRFAERHPDRGVPYTPIAFLLDSGHGWYQYENHAGAFSVPPGRNPAVLGYSRHDAMIRDWFNVAYYPLPAVEGEPLTSPRLSFVNAPMGDVFDVLVTSRGPKAADVLDTYRAVVLSGDVNLTAEWGAALQGFVQRGGTLVVTDDQVRGPGAAALELPAEKGEYASSRVLVWEPGGAGDGERLESNTYRYRRDVPPGTAIATAEGGEPVAVQRTVGEGRIIWIGVPKGLGLDGRATPVLSKVMLHLRQALLPVEVRGDVQYSLNRNETGWVVTLFNNRGNYKPQHGLGIPRRDEVAAVTLTTGLAVTGGTEWTQDQAVEVKADGDRRSILLDVPAGGIRVVHLAVP